MPTEQELLAKELNEINWKEVDEFPSLVDCEKIENKTQRQQCFFEILTQLIQEILNALFLLAEKESKKYKGKFCSTNFPLFGRFFS